MRLILLTIISLFCSISIAQNTPRFSQLNFAQGIYNPASIAIDGRIMADLMFRNQWLGVEGAPTTVALNGQYELREDMAVGLNMFYDKIGKYQTTSFAGQYAYRIPTNYFNFFALGVGLGIDNVVSDLASTQTTQTFDPAFAQSLSRVYFNASFGAYYKSPKFYIGISIPKLLQNTYTGADAGLSVQRWHYYLNTGFYLGSGKKFTFNPNIQIKAAINAPIQGDLILRNTFSGRFSLVVGYRSENSIIAGFDILISPNARLGYSFNYDVGNLAKIKGMSNELYLGLAFPYRNDSQEFGNRKYISKKGGHKNDFQRHSRRKSSNRGRQYGRDTRYRHL